MKYFIKNIKINKLFHLNNFDISIDDEEYPNLIITGKNGSGKTILLNAISDFLDKIKGDTTMNFLSYGEHVENNERILKNPSLDDQSKRSLTSELQMWKDQYNSFYGKIDVEFNNVSDIIDKYNKDEFVIAFYQADRKVRMDENKNPTKPAINRRGGVKDTSTSQFLNFLSDLKIQEALARNENQIKDANNIRAWFDEFEVLLQSIFEDKNLKLEFNYKDYSFRINTGGKSFKFTEMSDGFAAVIDVVADLILKMQSENSLTRAYQKEGIVLIDEVETHLHLGLQKLVMPMLSKIFPNIQFIITTHSPFVLSSMNNAVAFDLEHREKISELTEYSYESLAEGYFGVKTTSSYARMQLDNLKGLLEKETLTEEEKKTVKLLNAGFEKIPEMISPILVGEYRQLVTLYSEKITGLQ
ncbi:AAA family ATPase [Segatella paludivivens]|uniref:AAA family ATPase n=1 Tax=Segatella paludivivens TaxID=185294 RepID=UPI000382E8EF|nr:AAA family ATPase [Segatella paludivivens]